MSVGQAAVALYPQTGVAASARRVRALIRRHAYLLLKSWPRLVSMIYYPTVTMVLWGFVTIYLKPTNSFLQSAPGFFLGAVLLWDVLFRVNVQPADEDTVNRLEAVGGCPAARSAPDGVAGRDVLPFREDQRDVERDARGAQLFHGPSRAEDVIGQEGGREPGEQFLCPRADGDYT